MPSRSNHRRSRMPSRQESLVVGLLGVCGLVACGHVPQPQLYAGPPLSPTQVARITQDDYARILKVDEREVYGSHFEVLPGCHTVSVAYAVTLQKAGGFESGSDRVKAAYDRWLPAANTKKTTTLSDFKTTTTYETIDPVLFAIDMKPSIVYWFKATFDGSQFFPEVVEQDEANRSFPAGVRCPSPQARGAAQ